MGGKRENGKNRERGGEKRDGEGEGVKRKGERGGRGERKEGREGSGRTVEVVLSCCALTNLVSSLAVATQ